MNPLNFFGYATEREALGLHTVDGPRSRAVLTWPAIAREYGVRSVPIVATIVVVVVVVGGVVIVPVQTVNGQAVSVTSSTETAMNAAGGAVKTSTDNLMTALSDTSATVVDFSKEATKSVEEGIKAGGRATLALGTLASQIVNGLSATMATGSGYVANTFNGIDSVVGNWPILGVVSRGSSNFITGLSDTFNEISAKARSSRQKMFATLREQLNNSAGNGAAVAAGGDASASVAETK